MTLLRAWFYFTEIKSRSGQLGRRLRRHRVIIRLQVRLRDGAHDKMAHLTHKRRVLAQQRLDTPQRLFRRLMASIKVSNLRRKLIEFRRIQHLSNLPILTLKLVILVSA